MDPGGENGGERVGGEVEGLRRVEVEGFVAFWFVCSVPFDLGFVFLSFFSLGSMYQLDSVRLEPTREGSSQFRWQRRATRWSQVGLQINADGEGGRQGRLDSRLRARIFTLSCSEN